MLVALGGGAAILPSVATASTAFSYGFDTNSEGWTTVYGQSGTGPSTWTASGGNPGGAIQATGQSGEGTFTFFSSPSSIAGDYSAYEGETLSIDIKSSTAWEVSPFIGLQDDTGVYCTYDDTATLPTTSYRSLQVTLDADHIFTSHNNCSTPATEAQVAHLLANFQGMTLVAEDEMDAQETTTIDNVTLSKGPSTTHVSRQLTLAYSRKSKSFTGKLKAPDDPATCAASEKITIFRKHRGDDAKIGHPKTNAKGVYELKDPGKSGTYYSTVDRDTAGSVVCQAAKSGSVDLD